MATLAASRAETHVDSLFTYGSPRVGNEKFVSSLSYLPHFRFVNNADTVTKVPFRHWGYRHHGELRYIDAKGDVDAKSHVWSRFWDRIIGRLDGIGIILMVFLIIHVRIIVSTYKSMRKSILKEKYDAESKEKSRI
jgi:hypothetical protein